MRTLIFVEAPDFSRGRTAEPCSVWNEVTIALQRWPTREARIPAG